ncbi:MAG: MarR family winged helix-turn-helix transcriptional regulator [Pseudomonadota bacterium]
MNSPTGDGLLRDAMTDMFGPLSLVMVRDTRLAPSWRLSFLVNFFTGPLYREVFDRFALDRAGFVILYTLSNQGNLVARDICLATGLPKNSISRSVADLLKRDLVTSRVDKTDKRARLLNITAAGRTLVDGIVPMFESRQRAMRDVLTDAEKAAFDRCLEKMVFAMPRWVSPDE